MTAHSTASDVVAVRIPTGLLNSIDNAARRLGLRRSQFIRSALMQGVVAHWADFPPDHKTTNDGF
jgi:metal-responsive CopG/Arc/MetJ family transcriptional regulator